MDRNGKAPGGDDYGSGDFIVSLVFAIYIIISLFFAMVLGGINENFREHNEAPKPSSSSVRDSSE